MGEVVNLARYNRHKRATLDRVTGKYSKKLMKLYVDFAEDIAKEMERSLDTGKKSFKPQISKSLDDKITELFESHRSEAVYISVADGIQEVPVDKNKKLNSWTDYPILMPVEKTLTSLEEKEAKTLADQIDEKMGTKRPAFFMDLIDQSKKDVLKKIKSAYSFASKDWIAGESSIRDVKKALSKTLSRTKAGVDRVFRTETTRYFNDSRHEYFKKATGVTHYQIFAITDGRTSKICDSRHGYVVTKADGSKNKYKPPFHPNCRTILRPLLEKLSSHRKIIEKGMAMDERKFESLPNGWAA